MPINEGANIPVIGSNISVIGSNISVIDVAFGGIFL
jgi:hypothetical protein